MAKKILIVDNSLNKKCGQCSRFHRHFSAKNSVLYHIDQPALQYLDQYSHVILTGSSSEDDLSEVYERLRPLIQQAEKASLPILGVCFGYQALIATVSGITTANQYIYPKTGKTRIYVTSPSRLFDKIPSKFYAFEKHLSSVRHLPSELRPVAISGNRNILAFEHKSKPIFGIQFHPETAAHKRNLTLTNTNNLRNFNPEIAEGIISNFYRSPSQFYL